MSKAARPPRRTAGKPPSRQNPPAILCIDDDHAALATRKSLFQSAGYKVFTADCGSTGLEIAKTTHLDLAMVDCRMSGMSSYAVAALLRAIQPGMRILMLCAVAPRPAGINGEVDGILIKGQPAFRLLEQVANHVAAIRSRPLSWSQRRDSVA